MIRLALPAVLALLTATPLGAQTVLYEIALDSTIAMDGGLVYGYLETVQGDDLDGDGIGDLLIGTPIEWGSLEARSGRDGSPLWNVSGGPWDFARSLALAGDLDGDSIREVLVGSSDGPRLLGGAGGGQLWHYPSDGVNQLGLAVSTLEDIDGDGLPELLAGAPQFLVWGGGDIWHTTSNGRGCIGVFPGYGGGVMLHRSAAPAGQVVSFGGSVAGLGDVNGDGISDYVGVGSYKGWGGGRVGATYSGVDGSQLYRFATDWSSAIVERVGDLNADGVSDFAMATSIAGYVRFLSGADGSRLVTVQPGGLYDFLGFSVAPVGDQDGDGVVDVLIGAPQGHWMPYYEGRGYAILVSGADGQELQRFDGTEEGQRLGVGVGALDDLDGDGKPELLIGSARKGPSTPLDHAVIEVISL